MQSEGIHMELKILHQHGWSISQLARELERTATRYLPSRLEPIRQAVFQEHRYPIGSKIVESPTSWWSKRGSKGAGCKCLAPRSCGALGTSTAQWRMTDQCVT